MREWLLTELDRVPPIDIGDYPAVKAHLRRRLPALKRRQDKGGTPWNLRNCAYDEDGHYHYGDGAWLYVHDRTGVDLKTTLEDLAAERGEQGRA